MADCSDNGVIDATHSRQAIDTALSRIYGNTTDEPFGGCTPELWRLLDIELEEAGAPVRDCFANGSVDGIYSASLIEEARDLLPAVTDEFFPTCNRVLADAQNEAETMSAAASPIARATAKRYAERHGQKVAKRLSKVSAKVLLRRRASRWYAQVRWPAKARARGVCYVEVIVRRSGSKVRTGTAGRWCSTDQSIQSSRTRYPLTYSQAKRAAQKRGDQEAAKDGQRAKLSNITRTGTREFDARARWEYEDPAGCKGCGYDVETGQTYDTPVTYYCSAEIVVRRSSKTGKIRAKLDGKSCY